MKSLKDHQHEMVQLLANGSAIPASSSRMAHALHAVISLMLGEVPQPVSTADVRRAIDATTSGLNDVAIAAEPAPVPTGPTMADMRNQVKQLKHNATVYRRQLRAAQDYNRDLQSRVTELTASLALYQEAAAPCQHDSWELVAHGACRCCDCGGIIDFRTVKESA